MSKDEKSSAKKTAGGTYINANNNNKKGSVNIYDKNPRNKDKTSYHINTDYTKDKKNFTITEKKDGKTTRTSGSCYLTSACMNHLQETFDDNCLELTILRWFRDNFVSADEINHYYQTSPIIVSAIDELPDCQLIYNYIYLNVIEPCVHAIKSGDYDFAYNRYRSSILSLEETFARSELQSRLVETLSQATKSII